MQFSQRGQGNRPAVGDTRGGYRRSVYVPAFPVVPARKRPEQVPQLRTRVQIGDIRRLSNALHAGDEKLPTALIAPWATRS